MCWESGERDGGRDKGERRREEREERSYLRRGNTLSKCSFPQGLMKGKSVGSPWYSKMAVTSDRHGHSSPRQVTLWWSKSCCIIEHAGMGRLGWKTAGPGCLGHQRREVGKCLYFASFVSLSEGENVSQWVRRYRSHHPGSERPSLAPKLLVRMTLTAPD